MAVCTRLEVNDETWSLCLMMKPTSSTDRSDVRVRERATGNLVRQQVGLCSCH